MNNHIRVLIPLLGLAAGVVTGLACESGPECGPTEAKVARVIDGDTIELDTGERVRYLLVDTPEVSSPADCFGPEATEFNRSAVAGQTVTLSYDAECTDDFGRLLAYVELPNGRVINQVLLERGFACVLHIPPNGADRVDEYRSIEAGARAGSVGMWGVCAEVPC